MAEKRRVSFDPRRDYIEPERTRIEGYEARLRHLESISRPDDEYYIFDMADVRQRIARRGLPVDMIPALEEAENSADHPDLLGTHTPSGPDKGKLTFYSRLVALPAQAIDSASDHEVAHSFDPSHPEHAFIYGGETQRLQTLEHVKAIALQTIATGKHLNGYHAFLHTQYDRVFFGRSSNIFWTKP